MSNRKAKIPIMRYKSRRIHSFIWYNWPFKNKLSPLNLAACGLFHIGVNNNLKCFHCAVIIGDWNENSDPWLLHASASNNCSYLKRRQISQEKMTSDRPRHGRPKEIRIPSKTISQPPRSDRERVEDPLTQSSPSGILSDLEYTPASPYSPVTFFIDPAYSPVSPAYRPEMDEPARPPRYQHSVQSDKSNLETMYPSIAQDPEPSFSIPSTCTSSDVAISCKICLEEPMNTVLQPCNHLLMCSKCSENVTDCPICRQSIRNRYEIIVC